MYQKNYIQIKQLKVLRDEYKTKIMENEKNKDYQKKTR